MIDVPKTIECSLIVRQKTYRGASCVHEGVTYEIEARSSADGAPYDEDRDGLDCRILVEGVVEIEGQDVWELGSEIGESPADEPVRYLQAFLVRSGEDVQLQAPQIGSR